MSTHPENFGALRLMGASALGELGAAVWSDAADARGRVLVLFPAAWYARIPKGYPLETIMGRAFRFKPGRSDRDERAGFLAYGIRAKDDRGV